MNASIIIVTRDRAEDLRLTLAAMGGLEVPAGFEVELLVIDNGSSDGTAEVVSQGQQVVSQKKRLGCVKPDRSCV